MGEMCRAQEGGSKEELRGALMALTSPRFILQLLLGLVVVMEGLC